jgi:hypothetical protein
MDLDLDNLPSDVAVVLSDFGNAWNATGTHYFKIAEGGNRVACIEHEGLPGDQYGVAWETIWRFEAAGIVEWRPVPDFQLGNGLIGTVVLTEQGVQAAKRAARKDRKIGF